MTPRLLLILAALFSIGTAPADTFIVMNTDASGPGSLAQAVADANAHVNIDVPDRIEFAIPDSDPNRNPATGVFTITPGVFGFGITNAVVIDGYTQSGATANTLTTGNNAVLLIELNGTDAMFGGVGLVFFAGDSTVRGLVINRFTAGIDVGSGHVTVVGNFIGTDAAGAVSLGNGSGVLASGNGGNQIGTAAPADRNLISGNGNGVVLTNRSVDTNTVQNNYIGLNAAGTAALPNTNNGIVLSGVFSGLTGDTIIGAQLANPLSGERNVISGNGGSGIIFNAGGGAIFGPVTIQGNLIGLGANGTTALGNGGSGIEDEADPTATIGAVLIRQNIISSNGGDGILYASTNTTVQGNGIGTDITGTLDRGNAFLGIEMVGDHRDALDPSATFLTIGGTGSGDGNIISGNDAGGISIRNANAVIQGNFIGTQADGVSALGNNADGILVSNVLADPTLSIVVGGLAPGAGNTIAYNTAAGVHVGNSTVAILRNSIFNNGPSTPGSQSGLGIDLGSGPGVAANDPGDADAGPNGLQNYPVLTSVSITSGNVNITGSLESKASTTYELEFFGNDVLDPSGFGEGRTFLGATNVTTDGSGHVDFEVNYPLLAGALRPTATATDPLGNTSEFSASLGQLQNISTRLGVLSGDNVGVGGFIVTGLDPKMVIVRGIGPSLGGVGVGGALADPTLELRAGDGTLIASNDNWKSDQQTEIEGTGLQPTNDLESAIVATLPAAGASYTAVLQGKNGATGVGLIEAYDLESAANSQLANISTRGFVDTGDNAMIGGFILGGGTAEAIVRAIGPSLTAFGVAGALQDPTLELYDLFGTVIDSNDDWKDTQQTEIAASGLAPTNEKESAILMTLGSGAYTAIVRGQGNTTGVGLVEIYNLN
ncbi:MAG: right-handed parallel beta-helix repeat-containing protein [Verrucomicrobiota bacterium]|nr:right-handed parallel beta-helix repeat-containing protein [Verrucomicrobiota bacterium]